MKTSTGSRLILSVVGSTLLFMLLSFTPVQGSVGRAGPALAALSFPLEKLVTNVEVGGTPALVAEVPFITVVDEMLGEVHASTLYSYVGCLSGEWPVIVGGEAYTFSTRYSLNTGAVERATEYAHAHFEALGLATAYHTYALPNAGLRRNVIAEQPGYWDSERVFLVTAHLDSISEKPSFEAPGADDNASGVAAVLVAADILSRYDFAYTIRYVLFTGEEQGLHGSRAYAASLAEQGEELIGVLNMDMIGYNSDDAPILDLHARSSVSGSVELAQTFAGVVASYDLAIAPDLLIDNYLGNYSDNKPFWDEGYAAILVIEDKDDFTPYYHTTRDRLLTLDLPYFTEVVRTAVGTVAHQAVLVVLTCAEQKAVAGQPLAFSGVTSARSTGCQWDFGDGNSTTGCTVSHIYPFTGEERVYTVTLILDVDDELWVYRRRLTVHGVDVKIRHVPEKIASHAPVTLSVVVTPSVTPLTYTWDFGDGVTLTTGSETVSHTFAVSSTLRYTTWVTIAHTTGAWSVSYPITVVGPSRLFLPCVLAFRNFAGR